ncbi:MAG: site-specific integrase [Gammaproteobacteria bacterium]|nr:site-specific integrase [Gammaproteobacteria bacterium]
MTWLETPPLITLLPVDDSRRAYTLEWEEQERLLKGMLSYLSQMALYKVNTGCREQEVCNLKWAWEWKTNLPELDGRIFIIPSSFRKKVRDRIMDDKIVVLNDIAKSVVDARRGIHKDYVFTYRGRKVQRMNNNGWRSAWRKAGLPINKDFLRGVHNLRHTFGTRLRLLGVSNETRRDLMGHTVGNMTSHYSVAGIMELLEAVQMLCKSRKSPALSIVKIRSGLQTA